MTAQTAGRAPKVSAISIFLDAERYLKEAVDSVIAQDFGDFELLLVDDGSTDESSAIARDYARRHPDRIRYLQHPGHVNRGMSATRNLGIAEARGEYVAFIDSDDRWRPHKLREQVELLDRLPQVDAVCGSVNYWGSADGGEDVLVRTGHRQGVPLRPPEAAVNIYPLGRATAPSMSDLMFRRSSLMRAGGCEESFTGVYEDQALLSKFYLESTLLITNALWSDYRIHPASCMAAVESGGTYHQARHDFLRWYERFLAGTTHRHNPAIRKALRRALFRYEHPRLAVPLLSLRKTVEALAGR